MKKQKKTFNISKVPFIPAFDLLENKKNKLCAEEIAAIACALQISLYKPVAASRWKLKALEDSLESRNI